MGHAMLWCVSPKGGGGWGGGGGEGVGFRMIPCGNWNGLELKGTPGMPNATSPAITKRMAPLFWGTSQSKLNMSSALPDMG